jgi:hypothetical protein
VLEKHSSSSTPYGRVTIVPGISELERTQTNRWPFLYPPGSWAGHRLNHPVVGLAERRRSRTYQRMGYMRLPVLKTGWVWRNDADWKPSAPPAAPPNQEAGVQDQPKGESCAPTMKSVRAGGQNVIDVGIRKQPWSMTGVV